MDWCKLKPWPHPPLCIVEEGDSVWSKDHWSGSLNWVEVTEERTIIYSYHFKVESRIGQSHSSNVTGNAINQETQPMVEGH